jgi:hypothetical protein
MPAIAGKPNRAYEAFVGARRAKRRRAASPARDVHTKNSGMNSTAMNVAASMPPITPVPIE